jgi:hypothetical protein
MKNFVTKIAWSVVIASTVLSGCRKETIEENDEELITTMVLKLTPAGGSTVEYSFDDPDGPGGTSPVKQMIILAPNTKYDVSVQLLNKTANPAEDITQEVEEESDAHRFYYTPAAGSNITVSDLDNDVNAMPLGINSVWTTAAVANGKITVTLRHYPGNPPDKAAADAVNSPKSGTDIEVEFDTQIK